MKINFKIKDESEMPIKIGDRIRVKEGWIDKFNRQGDFWMPHTKHAFWKSNLVLKTQSDQYGNDCFSAPIADWMSSVVPEFGQEVVCIGNRSSQYSIPLVALEKVPKISEIPTKKTYSHSIKVKAKYMPSFLKDMEKLKLKYENKV